MPDNSTNAAIDVLMNSISTQYNTPSGEIQRTFDPEQLKFRMHDIDSDNYAAFVNSYKSVKSWASFCRRSTFNRVAVPIANMIEELADNKYISLTAKSSENGKFMKLLLQDRQEYKFTYAGDPDKKSGIVDAIKNHTGDNNPMNAMR